MTHRSKLLLATTCALLWNLPLGAAQSEGKWQEVENHNGIRVWRLEIPNESMPGFRGRTVIEAPPETVLAVIEKADDHPKWMYRCAAARILRRTSDVDAIVYNRTNAPWPVWDRDVVLDTHIERSADGKKVTLSFKETHAINVPVPHRVVRMPRLRGSYLLEEIAPNRSRVTYQVEVNIGGRIPAWLAERVARDMPYKTLSHLRKWIENGH